MALQSQKKKKHDSNTAASASKNYDSDEAEKEYQRQRTFLAGPKHSITENDMNAIDFSKDKNTD